MINTQPYDLQTQFCHVYIQLLSCRLTYVPEWFFMTFYLLCICCLLTEVHILLSKHREFFLYLPSLTIQLALNPISRQDEESLSPTS